MESLVDNGMHSPDLLDQQPRFYDPGVAVLTCGAFSESGCAKMNANVRGCAFRSACKMSGTAV